MTDRDILVVEDDAAAVELLGMACVEARVPWRLRFADDGVEALHLLLRDDGGPPPDLVLLDWRMPRQGGADVLRRLRATPRTRGLQVVVLTSSDRPRDREEALEAGADGFEVKPMRYAQLCELVRRIDAVHLERQAQP